jgi:hypothetical protein
MDGMINLIFRKKPLSSCLRGISKIPILIDVIDITSSADDDARSGREGLSLNFPRILSAWLTTVLCS